MRSEIRIAGYGGQGVLMCGIVIAKAASIFDNKYAVQTQSYGPEARGGASRTEVVICDEQVDYPKVEHPQIFVAMSHEALIKYIDDIDDEAILLIDPDLVYQDEIKDIITDKKLTVYHSKAAQTAEETIGKKIVSNIVMLGSFVEATRIISEEAAKESILDSVPKGTEELNMKAFEEGKKILTKI